MALGRDHSLLLGTGVQLVVSCTAIETQVVFKMLLTLITSQLAVAGQLGREVHLWSIRLLFGSGGIMGIQTLTIFFLFSFILSDFTFLFLYFIFLERR